MRLALPMLALALLAGCFTPDGGDATDPAANGTASNGTSETGDAPLEIAPVELEVSLVERPGVGVPPTTMAIDPAHLEVLEDQRVVITVTNGGQAPHNLVIDGLGETDMIGPGQSATLEFVAQEKGEFAMWCAVGGDAPTGHRAQGMEGVFRVA